MDFPLNLELQCFQKSEVFPQDVAYELLHIGCCCRCILRFMGEKDGDLYRNTDEDIEKCVKSLVSQSTIYEESYEDATPAVSADSPTAMLHKVKQCTACLGALQEFSSMDYLQKIQRKVHEEGFQFKEYLISISTPTCILCRQHSIMLHLKEKFPAVYSSMLDGDFPKIKDVWKWRNGPLLEELLGVPFGQKSPFHIGLTFTYANSDRECNFLLNYQPDIFRKRKQNRKYLGDTFTRANVGKALSDIPNSEFRRYFQCPPPKPVSECTSIISCTCTPLYLAGRYNKYSRSLSQTPWLINGVRKMENSVEELICRKIKEKYDADEYRFSSSGREDVDVRMLGAGRPFLVELINPHLVNWMPEDITQLQKSINGDTKDVKVNDLQVVPREETDRLKEGEMEKEKTYTALCWSTKVLTQEDLDKLAQYKDLKVMQKTPIRVIHRRPLADREKVIFNMSAEKIDKSHFRLSLSTQAGTYIKEFVHGDFGRTQPNLSTLLGMECDILELDVEEVKLDWPPSLDSVDEEMPVS
ncbi:hypothetical protein ScPMuIL_014744 [Solemya velum]